MDFIVNNTLIENVRNFHREDGDECSVYIFQHNDRSVSVESGSYIRPTDETEPELKVLLRDRRSDYNYTTYNAFAATQHTREDKMGHTHTFMEIFYRRDNSDTEYPYTMTVPMPEWTEVRYPDGERECFGDKQTQNPPSAINQTKDTQMIVRTRNSLFQDVDHIRMLWNNMEYDEYGIYSDGNLIAEVNTAQLDFVAGGTYTVCLKDKSGDKTSYKTLHNVVGIETMDSSMRFTYHPESQTQTTLIPHTAINDILITTPSGDVYRNGDIDQFRTPDTREKMTQQGNAQNTDVSTTPQTDVGGDNAEVTTANSSPNRVFNAVRSILPD